ncbi:hypothetical protein E4U41_002777 [Claviceps citrina]|nr:hypothetical protein E4U41_002777 [Claviceps citrina]
MSSESPPKFVYKIEPTAPPAILPEHFPLSPLDQQDGFIHLSTGQQVNRMQDAECTDIKDIELTPLVLPQTPLTCDRFFSTTSTLYVFKFELARFADAVKWEDGFPHLYGKFGKEDVSSVEKFERAEGQTWADAMSASAWLE